MILVSITADRLRRHYCDLLEILASKDDRSAGSVAMEDYGHDFCSSMIGLAITFGLSILHTHSAQKAKSVDIMVTSIVV
eukprot:scaffold17862_cov122-Skeletonema_dohrnii-CCMP3373.AAC.4